MKHIFLFSTLVFMASNAFAIFMPGAEQPLSYANDMRILDIGYASEPFESPETATAVLQKKDGASDPTSILILVTRKDGTKATLSLPIRSISKNSCGAYQYLALDTRKEALKRYEVLLTDYTSEACRIERLYKWEVQITDASTPSREVLLSLAGDPQPAFQLKSN